MLRTVEEVADVLGDGKPVTFQRRYGISPAQWYNWKIREKRIPPRFYLRMIADLAERGRRADPSLWGIEDAVA